ncbi:Cysteine/O-acetylserine efflux protein [bacterium YEK0313]|nr:Cysteine/O-acetylserine efflux protein [bacterium YEK0313]
METVNATVGLVQPLAGLALAALVVMGSPGPATVSATAMGAAFGLRRSSAYVAGLILGTTAVLLAVAAGLVSLLMSQPRLAPVLLWLSVAYIVYLAIRIAMAPPLSDESRAGAAPSLVGGLLLAVANPKAYVAIAAVYAGTRLAGMPPLAEAGVKIAVLTAMIVVIHVVWLVAGASFARLLRHPVAARVINIAFALLLLATVAVGL